MRPKITITIIILAFKPMILIGCQQFFQYWLAVKIISQSDSDVIVLVVVWTILTDLDNLLKLHHYRDGVNRAYVQIRWLCVMNTMTFKSLLNQFIPKAARERGLQMEVQRWAGKVGSFHWLQFISPLRDCPFAPLYTWAVKCFKCLPHVFTVSSWKRAIGSGGE